MYASASSCYACVLIFIVSAGSYTEQRQCGVANLPAFGDRRYTADYLGRPRADRLQAIVPAYTFNCTGRVTEWRACVDQAGVLERYYIQFQVWRPTWAPGCYRLVGYNAPPPPIFVGNGELGNAGELLQPDVIDDCVHLPVNENEQIQFQPGDVIGYYADQFELYDDDPDNGGVQVVSDENVVVYNIVDVPLDDLKTQYTIPALGSDPSSCGFELEGSDSDLFQITSSIAGAPIISLSLATTVVTSEIQSNGIRFSTSTIPDPKPTSALTSTPTVSINIGVPSSTSINGNGSGTDCEGGCSGSTGPSNSLPDIVGVACALLVLVTGTVIIIAVLVCLRKRKKEPNLVNNVAYISGTREETRENMMHSEGETHIFTSTNEAYRTSTKVYVATNVLTATNPAYQAAQCQSGRESFLYDYPRPD